ncbi:unnamed protein product [Candida verbasci]|uniref:DNA helicase n=1 Tax=Candida verbasci TaxID=1227364 RepID=A0A9W4TTD3_9ASCO|nr:unnamed protein product [Candida verbasci]
MKLIDSFKDAIINEQKSESLEYESLSAKKLYQLNLAVFDLDIVNLRTSLNGKSVFELKINSNIDDVSIKNGDIIKIKFMKDKDKKDVGIDGVVLKCTKENISVVIDESVSDDEILQYYNNTDKSDSRVCLIKMGNSITYKRMLITMDKLNTFDAGDKNDIHRILLGESKHTINEEKTNFQLINQNLNPSQRQAAEFATKSNISVIHGPPGTGKTYTLIELIQQLTNMGEKVLVCGPSNISVDLIIEKLSKSYNTSDIIRIGHPARLLPVNLQHSLEVQSRSNEGKEIIRDVEKDINSTLNKIKKVKRYAERKELYQELKFLKKELRIREKKIVNDLLQNAKVIVATLHGSGSYELRNLKFDTVIIDEVAQALEPQCWIPLMNINKDFKRFVIAGDNLQLPPTIMSKNKTCLNYTLFDRIVKLHGDKFKKFLNIQYRMNSSIMKYPSLALYENKLKCDSTVETINLLDLPNVEDNEDSRMKCIFYDTIKQFQERKLDQDETGKINSSISNEGEVSLVKYHLQKLIDSGVKEEDIGIIAPYSAQVQLIKKQFEDTKIEISTVDGFQGREKEVIILSLVRSNDDNEIGFLAESRRLNVAITRAKRQLCLIGDLELLGKSKNKFLVNWSKYIEDGVSEGTIEPYEIIYPDVLDYIE